MAETKLKWMHDNLKCQYEFDESVINLTNKQEGVKTDLSAVELTGQ